LDTSNINALKKIIDYSFDAPKDNAIACLTIILSWSTIDIINATRGDMAFGHCHSSQSILLY